MQVSFFNGLFQAIRPRHPHMLAEAQDPRLDIAGVGDGEVELERPTLAADHFLVRVPLFLAGPGGEFGGDDGWSMHWGLNVIACA